MNYKYTLNIHSPNERDGLYIDSSEEEDKVREETPQSDFNDLQNNLLKLCVAAKSTTSKQNVNVDKGPDSELPSPEQSMSKTVKEMRGILIKTKQSHMFTLEQLRVERNKTSNLKYECLKERLLTLECENLRLEHENKEMQLQLKK